MFKGMQRGLLCVCLLAVLVAPAAGAESSRSEASPWDSASYFVSDILAEVWQGLSDFWHSAFSDNYTSDGFEADETIIPPPEEGDGGGASTQSAGGDPPPPPGGENDDDGNIGGGSDPWG